MNRAVGKENSNYEKYLALRSTDKPRAPLEGWSIVLITNLDSPSEDVFRHCIVAIDCFSKFSVCELDITGIVLVYDKCNCAEIVE